MKTAIFCVGLVLAAGAAQATVDVGALPNFDAYRQQLASIGSLHDRPAARSGEFDRRMNLPTFLWAADAPAAAVGALQPKALTEARGREYLRGAAESLRLTAAMIDQARLSAASTLASGASIARFQQTVDGVEVFNRSLNVLMNRAGRQVAISGYFSTDSSDSAPAAFARSAAQAVAAAFAGLGGALDAGALTLTGTRENYELYDLPAAGGRALFTRPPRVKRVYYPRVGALEPAYYVELFGAESGAYSLVISALDGALLFRKNLTANEAYSYRVFADAGDIHQPFDSPLGNSHDPFEGHLPGEVLPRVSAAANLVTLDHGPISTGDPWLAAGATTTTGNNADAFLDTGLIANNDNTSTITDGYQANSSDLRTQPTGPNTFDYAIAADQDPTTDAAQNAAIVNLFYLNNWLHDWWYDHGFDEVSGNAQTSNYGRGGMEGDAISAQGQDASGRDNANMATPADGSSPTMQMYLFDGSISGDVRVTAPSAGNPLVFTGASFGPTAFDVTAEAALANESAGASPSDGCSAVMAAPVTGTTTPAAPDANLNGKIALVDRGSCSFTTKEQFATLSRAVALVVINNKDGSPVLMGNADVPQLPVNVPLPSTDTLYNLPAVMITKADGEALKAALAAGQALSMHVQRLPSIDFDGTLDEQIIAHEFFHHVSNRLVGNANGLNNLQGGGMGEGWSDVNALLLSVRPEDRLVPGNASYEGAYGLAYYAVPGIVPVGSYYYGIRRAPYSTDFSRNSLSFQHIQDGTPLPETSPFAGGQDGANNSEVHNTGEVWANMVWECYAALLNDPRHSFLEARSLMMDYLIAGLKMTPSSPTFTEARDGILAAAMANDEKDYVNCGHGFARRGAGKDAVAPDRAAAGNVGVTESYVEFGNYVPPGPIVPLPVAAAPATLEDHSRFGGALSLALLLPLLGGALRRQRC